MVSQYLNSRLDKKSDVRVMEYHKDTPLADYDLVSLHPEHLSTFKLTRSLQDFHFPVKVLESNGVRLEPFIVRCFSRASNQL